MSNIFITGMGRSGTTLLEKLLNSHNLISILSQPFPLLFTSFKKEFLIKKYINKYYVLNDSIYNGNYDIEEFNEFVKNTKISETKILEIFELMKDYSGQKTKINLEFPITSECSFFKLFRLITEENSMKNNTRYYGSKEILCEEYLPSMLNEGIKTIIIIRDPRDVLASANYPRGEKYLGNKKPTLFLLRSWRKSVDFTKYLTSNKNFHYLKYEDLVQNPYTELDKITKFLNVPDFELDFFEKGIYDQKGNLWSANSSLNDASSFISQKSVGAFKKVLSDKEIEYTETICRNEMLWLGYEFEAKINDPVKVIENYKDFNIEENPNLQSDFSSSIENVKYEISRSYEVD